MKRIAIALLAGVAAVAGLGQNAWAADLAVKAAPAPVLAPTWTGFYIGVHGGAAWQSTPNWTFFDPNGALVALPINGGNAELGGVGGIQGGYNWQFAPAWVVGVEGDISWASLSDHRTTGPLLTPLGNIAGGNLSAVSMSANTQWLASARGKLGFTGWLNNTMFYATGGVAWENVEYAATLTAAGGGPGPFPGVVPQANSVTSFSTTKSGWVAGGGAEWQATTNILLRAEYLYYNFNNNVTGSAGTSPAIPVTLPLPFNYNWSKDNVQVFRVAGSYKF
jgi:outer membrane immunogenic protein